MELKDNRYYTPDDVSELHVGLECVWTMLDNGFKNVRIKYIDGEDLENLGFSKTDKKDPYTGSNLYMKNIEYGFNTGVNITDSIAMAIERAINKGETYTDVEIISKMINYCTIKAYMNSLGYTILLEPRISKSDNNNEQLIKFRLKWS